MPSPTVNRPDFLDRIVARIIKDEEPAFRAYASEDFPLRNRREPRRILDSLDRGFGVIAEVKKGSPSQGMIRQDYDPAELARSYEAAGAVAISVLTEKNFFFGEKHHLRLVKRAVRLPVLRKDFIVHPRQIYESYNLGADFILLIAACLPLEQLKNLHVLATSLGMETLIEVHTAGELRRVIGLHPRLIGINNRNLRDFSVDWETSLRLRDSVPPGIHVISESGLRTREQVRALQAHGFSGALVGEHLLRQPEPGRALRELLHG